jgi:NAD-dependent SIR2 family protein deacetylase
MNERVLFQAAEVVQAARSILVAAGAGMGVDSGLPDFRGNEGFWQAYPPYRHLGLSFVDLANPSWFEQDPSLAWGFYGHRLNLYRATQPHAGFDILRSWILDAGHGFVFTSNVDGQFHKAGFRAQEVVECHGSLHHLQCMLPCSNDIWSASATQVIVDENSFRASEPLPACFRCGALARPNILMFGDARWCSQRSAQQEALFEQWLQTEAQSPMVVIECGAGRAVPTVRNLGEWVAARFGASLIRINLREPEGPKGTISKAMPALRALQDIDTRIQGAKI